MMVLYYQSESATDARQRYSDQCLELFAHRSVGVPVSLMLQFTPNSVRPLAGRSVTTGPRLFSNLDVRNDIFMVGFKT